MQMELRCLNQKEMLSILSKLSMDALSKHCLRSFSLEISIKRNLNNPSISKQKNTLQDSQNVEVMLLDIPF